MYGGSKRRSRSKSRKAKVMTMPHIVGMGGAHMSLTLACPKKRKGKYTIAAIKRQHLTKGKVRKGHEKAFKIAILKYITNLY